VQKPVPQSGAQMKPPSEWRRHQKQKDFIAATTLLFTAFSARADRNIAMSAFLCFRVSSSILHPASTQEILSDSGGSGNFFERHSQIGIASFGEYNARGREKNKECPSQLKEKIRSRDIDRFASRWPQR